MEDMYKVYLHNPPHYFVPNAMYMVTAAIVHNQHLLSDESTRKFVLQTLFERSKLHGWDLQAWAILNNHYHFIARASDDPKSLAILIRQLHSITAIEINKQAGMSGRQIWANYWDTCLTYEKSYLARLHYIHMNSVKHGLVDDPVNYVYCSYKWFLENGGEDLKSKVFAQPIDRINVKDDF